MKTDIAQAQIIHDFSQLSSWEEKYQKIISLGKDLPAMDDALKSDDIKVKGCQSQVWLHAERGVDGRINFTADSDALIVKGLIALLLKVYSGQSAEYILKTEPSFIEELGLKNQLSPSRANGLFAMIKQIKYYALAFSHMPNP